MVSVSFVCLRFLFLVDMVLMMIECFCILGGCVGVFC